MTTERNQKDIEAGTKSEHYVSNALDEDHDRCLKNHRSCQGKYCKDYRQAWVPEMAEPLPYRPKTRNNSYGELVLDGGDC